MQAGVIDGADPAVNAQMIWAAIHGWVSLELSGISFVDDQAAGAHLLSATMLKGLRPSP